MHAKKGVVETQFNWVFTLIIGAVVLLLFTGIAARQKNISDTSTEISIIKTLDTIFSGLETSHDTIKEINVPKTKIEFGCNTYTIGKVSRELKMTIFTPSIIEGNNFISMTLGWKLPYKVTNIIYLASPKTRYVFVGRSDFAKKVFEMIPDGVKNDGYTNIEVIQDENDDIVRLIFFDQEPKLPENLRNVGSVVTALRVNGNEDSGTLEFFESVDDTFESEGKSNYIKEETLFGAIFSDDIENYE